MPIPDYQSIMLPLLKFASDKKEHSMREAIEDLADSFKLSEEEKKEVLPSGQQYVFDNRVAWARTYLKKAGLLESTRRSFFKITDLGLNVLSKNPKKIDVEFLKQFPQFIEFLNSRREKTEEEEEEEEEKKESEKTPEELLETGYQRIKSELAQELLERIKQLSPKFFEKLVVDLLIKMGYGGSLKEAGKAIGQSRDGGIDGIIKEDKLGLDVIYIQAKRWNNDVGSKEVRNFVGSLAGQHANKGVFITTSKFTKDALEYVKTISHKIILINGEMLTELLIENDVGVTKLTSYDIKKIDLDYFEEE
ncbi:MAG: restriction endonuclease [Thermoflavifilum sp.]|nr:restriction endonuclease [Thermoflavifilum sp.]